MVNLFQSVKATPLQFHASDLLSFDVSKESHNFFAFHTQKSLKIQLICSSFQLVIFLSRVIIISFIIKICPEFTLIGSYK